MVRHRDLRRPDRRRYPVRRAPLQEGHLPGRIEVRLSIWALHGTPAAIAFDIIDETARRGSGDVEVPAFVAEVPLTLGELLRESGVLLDLDRGAYRARVMLELARQAEAS
jgi:hypothetical protein